MCLSVCACVCMCVSRGCARARSPPGLDKHISVERALVISRTIIPTMPRASFYEAENSWVARGRDYLPEFIEHPHGHVDGVPNSGAHCYHSFNDLYQGKLCLSLRERAKPLSYTGAAAAAAALARSTDRRLYPRDGYVRAGARFPLARLSDI